MNMTENRKILMAQLMKGNVIRVSLTSRIAVQPAGP